MQTIYRGNKTFQQFDFQKVSLSSPIRVGNGNYFMKYKANDQSLYVQPPQCLTKQGILNVSKKYYIDLLFTNEDADFIQWMEKLEETTVEYIYKNRSKWFDGDMEKDDIENYFSSPFRIFRSGKYYILRVSIATSLGMPAIKVYDSDQNEVSVDDINDTTQVMCILEIKGVKCGTRNFQMELETKQLMIVKPSNPFDKCLFDANVDASIAIKQPVDMVEEAAPQPVDMVEEAAPQPVDMVKEAAPQPVDMVEEVLVETVDETNSTEDDYITYESENIPEVPVDISYNLGNTVENETTDQEDIQEPTTILETTTNDQDLGEQLEIMEDTFDIASNEMEEVSFPLDDLEKETPIQLKERNDIYYEMYYEARKKAKMAKEMALNCYLEAKNIKNTYMLNDLEESDSDENISEF
jgi:hypothetical protein|uniref:Uncharacterized protein n=1 Tax=viral metagenome TaxID=1070528 RepID=A0A6C0IMP9_9ZZZZ